MSLPLFESATPAPPTLSDLLSGDSRCARLAKYFVVHRGEWIDGRRLASIAGAYAWRTRISDLRHAPWCLDIQNRIRTVEDESGDTFKVSEYCLMPTERAA